MLCSESPLPHPLMYLPTNCPHPLDAHKILYGVSSALEYLATKQIEHNDIKPKNIAYCRDRGAVLFDFGTATSPLFKGPVGGTPWYMPPEFLETSARGAPGDIWALGITMLYVIGKIEHPNRSSNNWRLNNLRRQDESAHRKALAWLRFISKQREKLNQMDNVESLVDRMLQKEPTSRIDAAAIVAELKLHGPEPIDPKQ
ncbi:kinase-like domain-containing protein [Trichoderma sp. SZMC 28013]